MSLSILYCDHTDVDFPANHTCDVRGESAIHIHPDASEYVCLPLTLPGENYPTSFPWLCGDGTTMVNTWGEFYTYLDTLLP